MIPIKDDNPRILFPFVTILLIVVNILVFIYQSKFGHNVQVFVYKFGAIPLRIAHPEQTSVIPLMYRSGIPPALTLITSMFLHGGFLHLAGNMLYLWIFGDNVEGIMGHARFLFFYLICGILASLGHVLLHSSSVAPMIGASGAISAVLGAYAVRFPAARVHVLIIFFFFIRIIRVPAIIMLGIWFIVQIMSNLLAGPAQEGVAWSAHIGGFISGIVFVFMFENKRRLLQSRRRLWW